MSLLRNKLKSNFSQIPNELITDSELSGIAFRIVVYLFSKPDKWDVNNTDIQKRFGIKRRETMSKYWKEIVMSGWVTRERKVDEKSGKMVAGFDYTLHSKPCTDNADTLKADTHETVYGYDRVRINSTLSNTDSFSNTDIKKDLKENKKEKDILGLFNYWVAVFKKDSTKTKLTDGRKTKLTARLKKYSVEEIQQAIKNCSQNKFNVDNGHTDLVTICRSDEKFEYYRDLKPNNQNQEIDDNDQTWKIGIENAL